MKVSHYLEFESAITGGIRRSVAHQRAVLARLEVAYTTAPTTDADVLQLNLVGPRSVGYALAARKRGVPVVAHTHVTAEDVADSFRGTNALARPLRPYLERAYGLADRLVCPSAYTADLIGSYTDTPTTVISNGVDRGRLSGFDSLEGEYRRRYDLDSPTVFLVGHVLKRKGLETFVELARRLPDLDFAWFGPVDRRLKGRETRRLIDDSPGNCTFTGYIDDVRGAYAAGDVFCFPTHEENEGIALLEAMATGNPVVVRDIEAFSWLADGEDCLKVSGGVSAFVAAIERLRDPDRRERLGRAAAARSEAFSLDAIAGSYRELYRDLDAEVS